MKILFTYLVAFSGNGGIERFNRCFILALQQICENNGFKFNATSLYDTQPELNYVDEVKFKGFGRNKLRFLIDFVLSAVKYDVVILGHINLAVAGCMLNFFYPKKKIVLIVHGIDTWGELSFFKKTLLKKVDIILSVSEFTKEVIISEHGVNPKIVKVFPNTIDPGLEVPISFNKPPLLIDRYGVNTRDKVLLTITRMSSQEKYKGYDVVLRAFAQIKLINFKYLLCGKYDQLEYERITSLISELKLENNVVLAGYIKEDELLDHYLIADTFIMPSKGEGFGIVFIEAMFCGLKVIAGNKDGSVDALDNGRLGTLINPDNVEEIGKAILISLENKSTNDAKFKIQQKAIAKFGFEAYKNRLEQIIKEI